MRNFIALLMLYFIRFALSFRYKVTVKGMEKLNKTTLNKPGGVLFLPNHPTAFVDPTLVTLAVWKKYPLRPMIVEYMYYTPGIHAIMQFLNALPIPNFVTSTNSFKKKKVDRVMEEVIHDLKNGQNFLIYPAGKTKHQAKEIIGASGIHRILQATPEANVVLVKTTGLWGSRFSRALNGSIPPIFSTIFWGMKEALKSLIFFLPRREVTLEFTPAPADFPYKGTRMEINRYLESWYNRSSKKEFKEGDEEPGETLNLVSYSRWKQVIPEIKSHAVDEEISIDNVSDTIKDKIKKKLSEMSQIRIEEIDLDMNLNTDLGLDSLDIGELVAFLDDEYEVAKIPVNELTTVGKVIAVAANQSVPTEVEEEGEEDVVNVSGWFNSRPHERAEMAPGETIPEVFLNTCDLLKKQAVCADKTAGVLTYQDAKLRVLLLANYIRTLPGDFIGILLPSSVAAYLTIIACQLAGKVPLMVNWTVGSRHLESLVALSDVQVVLSSWAFLDRLENADLQPVEDKIIMLEDVRRGFSLKDKIKAFYHSKLSARAILSIFKIDKLTKNDRAVLLFTSGTESMPKGVPLTFENILSNQRAALMEVEIYKDDIWLGMLPPFHSFGFSISGILPLLCGTRVAYFPDPTDSKAIINAVGKWKATLICGAPSFLKGIVKNASDERLNSLRFCFAGAEKSPESLFKTVSELKNCRLLEGYGITECSPILTTNLSGDPLKGLGKPLPGTKLCVVHLETQKKLQAGQQGLILARGPNIFGGYLNKNVASPFITVENESWYSTGDIGYINDEGSLVLSGRFKRFFKIGGEMISLASIEDALQRKINQNASFEENHALAVCVSEEEGEKVKLVLFVNFPITLEDSNRFLREAGLSNLVKIFKVERVNEIPLMGTGKINYRALEAQLPEILKKATENLSNQGCQS